MSKATFIRLFCPSADQAWRDRLTICFDDFVAKKIINDWEVYDHAGEVNILERSFSEQWLVLLSERWQDKTDLLSDILGQYALASDRPIIILQALPAIDLGVTLPEQAVVLPGNGQLLSDTNMPDNLATLKGYLSTDPAAKPKLPKNPDKFLESLTLPITADQSEILYWLIKQDHEAAKTRCLALLEPVIMGMIRKKVDARKRHDIADIMQEVFLTALRNISHGKFNIKAYKNIGGYITGIVRYKLLEYYRARDRHRSDSGRPQKDKRKLPDEVVAERDLLEKALREIENLDPKYGDLMKMKLLEDLTLDQIAKRTNLEKTRISSLLHYGLKLLGAALKKNGIISILMPLLSILFWEGFK